MITRRLIFTELILLFVVSVYAQNSAEPDPSIQSGPGSYKILSGEKDRITIPFTMHNGKPLMELEINGRKATLMIDNGVLWDQIWLFGSPLVEELELKPSEEIEIGGSGKGDPTQAFVSSNLTLKFKDIVFYEQPVLVSPPVAGFARMFPGADGQLCNTFFKHFIVEFDFIRNEIILHKAEHFQYTGDGSILDMQANASGTYSVPFAFKMPDEKIYNDRVDIDFGGIYPLKITLNNKHNIQLPSDVKETFSFGAQGRSSEFLGKISSMSLGKYTFDSPVVIFGDEKSSRIHPDNLGVIGLPLFMRFDIIFDYFNNRIYLDPNKNYHKLFE